MDQKKVKTREGGMVLVYSEKFQVITANDMTYFAENVIEKWSSRRGRGGEIDLKRELIIKYEPRGEDKKS